MHKLLIQPRARSDIKNIWHYTYKSWGEQQADNYTDLNITLLFIT